MKTNNYFKLIEFENFLHEKLQRKVDVGFLDSMKSFIKNAIEDDLIYVK
jgi:predicted nucleotidyltransferase